MAYFNTSNLKRFLDEYPNDIKELKKESDDIYFKKTQANGDGTYGSDIINNSDFDIGNQELAGLVVSDPISGLSDESQTRAVLTQDLTILNNIDDFITQINIANGGFVINIDGNELFAARSNGEISVRGKVIDNDVELVENLKKLFSGKSDNIIEILDLDKGKPNIIVV